MSVIDKEDQSPKNIINMFQRLLPMKVVYLTVTKLHGQGEGDGW